MATATTRGESPVISPVKTHQGDRSLSDLEVYTRVAGRDQCTYSNVVHSDVTAVDQRDIRDNSVLRGIRAQMETPASEEELSKLSSAESLDRDDDDERPWTVVSKGKNKKTGHSHVNTNLVHSSENKKSCTSIQDNVVAEAERQLTTDERNQIWNRYKNVHKRTEADSFSESEASSKGEGPL
jgi:hypothetical protein